MFTKSFALLFSLMCSLALSVFANNAFSCTSFFSSGSESPLVAANLDWYSGDGAIYVNKRSIHKVGTLIGGQKPASWVSKYASLTVTESGREFPWEGMNEAGVSVNALELMPSQVPSAQDPRPALEMLQWIQYILDTSANVSEAIVQAHKVRVGVSTTIHYFVCDASSVCAVFEYIGGELVVHAGADLPYRALANSTYENSVTYFRSVIQNSTPAVVRAGTSTASYDRFSRAALWSKDYSSELHGLDVLNSNDEVAYAFTGLANLAEIHQSWRTVWSMVFNLKTQTLSLTTLAAPKLKSIALGSFEPNCSSGAMMMDVNDLVAGDAHSSFHAYTSASNRSLVERNAYVSASDKPIVEAYPETQTHCEP